MALSDAQTGRGPSDHVRKRDFRQSRASPTDPNHLPCMLCSLPRWTGQVLVGFFPARAAFPVLQAGRHPHRNFRGLLKLHSRYGLQGCSPTIRGLYREAPPSPVPQLERSQAIKSYQQLLEWVLPPLVIYALGAH